MKIFKKENLGWSIPIIILIVNIFVVFYGRIYYPENWHPKTTSFIENYFVWCLFELACVFFPCLIIGMWSLIIISIVPKWNREFHLSIFRSWNPTGYQKIKDEEERREQGLSYAEYYKEENPRQSNQLSYKYKERINISNHIVLETFDSDNDFYRAVTNSDIFVGKTKDEFIQKLKKEYQPHSAGAYYCVLEGNTIESKRDEIINKVEKLEDFKWIRLNYFGGIDNLTEFEKQKFENMKLRGFPNYGIAY